MLIQDIDLRALAGVSSSDRAFLSLYLSGPTSLTRLESKFRTIENFLSGNPDELTQFRENLKRVKAYVLNYPVLQGSLCLFSCWILDFFRAFPLHAPVEDLARIGPSPYIRPIAEHRRDYESVAVIVADNSRARIFLFAAPAAEAEEIIKGHIKNHVKVGGWSQQRYERRRDKALEHYGQEIVEALVGMAGQGRIDRVLLVGSKETMAAVEARLPRPLADKLAGEKPLDISRGEAYIHREIYELYLEQEREAEIDLWQTIKNRIFRCELAAAGPAEVLETAEAGRVEKAIINRGARIPGTRCPDSNRVFAGCFESCPDCSSLSVFPVDLVNVITEKLTLTGAEAEFVDPIPELQAAGDVAALLRY